MHVEFLVEGPSDEIAIVNLVPMILGEEVSFDVHPFGSKVSLMSRLLGRLKGYSYGLPEDWRIVVVVDEDREDCMRLKSQLEDIALEAGFRTKSSSGEGGLFQVLNRLAVEELEAWFFGDVEAMKEAYPRIPRSLNQKAGFRNPDDISGGTWEALEKVLKKYGYHRGGLNKIEAARDISAFMNPQRNSSKSFQVFRDGLVNLTQQGLNADGITLRGVN